MKTMIFARLAETVAAIGLLVVSLSAAADVTDSFTARYKISYGIFSLGTITFSLQPDDDARCFVYSGQGHPGAIVAMLIGELSETSHFCLTDDGQIRPQHFQYREKGDADDSYTLVFNWKDGTVLYRNRAGQFRTMTLPDTANDMLTLQVAARQWLASSPDPSNLPPRTFTLVEEDKIKHYTFAVEDGGTLKLPGGLFDTLIVKRIDHEDKQLRFWLAAYADWIPVKVEHERHGRVITMELTDLQRAETAQ